MRSFEIAQLHEAKGRAAILHSSSTSRALRHHHYIERRAQPLNHLSRTAAVCWATVVASNAIRRAYKTQATASWCLLLTLNTEPRRAGKQLVARDCRC